MEGKTFPRGIQLNARSKIKTRQQRVEYYTIRFK